jgi:hypothetical protein
MRFALRFIAELAFLAVLAGCLVLTGGCITGGGYSTRDKLLEVTREYNQGVRWRRFEQAAEHLPLAERRSFFDRHKALEEELDIADCELTRLDIDSKKEHATARVDYVWTLRRRGLVEKTTTDQVWEKKDGEWQLASEVRVSGAPLCLFDEPPRAAR